MSIGSGSFSYRPGPLGAWVIVLWIVWCAVIVAVKTKLAGVW